MENCCDIWPDLAQYSLLQSWQSSKAYRHLCGCWIIFQTATTFPEKLQASRCSIGKCSNEIHSVVTPALTFTAEIHHTPHTIGNHPHSLRIPLLSSTWEASYHEQLLCGTDTQDYASPIGTIVTCSSLGLTVILSTYSHKLCLLFCNSLLRVTFGPCPGWTLLQKHSSVKMDSVRSLLRLSLAVG